MMPFKLYLYTLRNFTAPHCSRCDKIIDRGERYRADKARWPKYCERCVGWFLSRYAMTFEINDLTQEEMLYQKLFDEEAERMRREGVEIKELCTVAPS